MTPEGGQEGEPLSDSGTRLSTLLSGSVVDATTVGIPAEEMIVVELRDPAATIDGWPDPVLMPLQSLKVRWEGQETTWSTRLGPEEISNGVMIYAFWDDGIGDLYDGPRGRFSSEPLFGEGVGFYSGLTVAITDQGEP